MGETDKNVEKLAKRIRLEAIRMVYEGGEGHPGPAFSIADILAALYGKHMNIRPEEPLWPDRDRLVLSKGHACPALYAVLSEKGYFGGKPVDNFHLREIGSKFQGHPVMQKTPGVDMTSGSLGNGISIGCGMALAAKYNHKDYHTYVICGDGELNEGVIWEGVMCAAHQHLNNLSVFVDNNQWQSGGSTADVSGMDNIADKFRAFGWNVLEIDGHDYAQLDEAITVMKESTDQPTCVVCHDIKGKGLPYMENDNTWHKHTPTKEQYELACELLGEKDHE